MSTGRIVVKRKGGGHKQRYRMVDYMREPPEDGSVYEERVLEILYDPCRSARIALVAGGNHKRYIIATVNMKAGDIIRTSGQVSRLSGKYLWLSTAKWGILRPCQVFNKNKLVLLDIYSNIPQNTSSCLNHNVQTNIPYLNHCTGSTTVNVGSTWALQNPRDHCCTKENLVAVVIPGVSLRPSGPLIECGWGPV